jgi:hypothetical protein
MDTKEIKYPKCHKKAKKIMSLWNFQFKGGGLQMVIHLKRFMVKYEKQ